MPCKPSWKSVHRDLSIARVSLASATFTLVQFDSFLTVFCLTPDSDDERKPFSFTFFFTDPDITQSLTFSRSLAFFQFCDVSNTNFSLSIQPAFDVPQFSPPHVGDSRVSLVRLEDLGQQSPGGAFSLTPLEARGSQEFCDLRNPISTLISTIDSRDRDFHLFYCPPTNDRLFGPLDVRKPFGDFAVPPFPVTFFLLPSSSGAEPYFFVELGSEPRFFGAVPWEAIIEFTTIREYTNFRVNGVHLKLSMKPPVGSVIFANYELKTLGLVKIGSFDPPSLKGRRSKVQPIEVPRGLPLRLVLAHAPPFSILLEDGIVLTEFDRFLGSLEVKIVCLGAPLFTDYKSFCDGFNAGKEMAIELRKSVSARRDVDFVRFDRKTKMPDGVHRLSDEVHTWWAPDGTMIADAVQMAYSQELDTKARLVLVRMEETAWQ
jgi:hypothetical protein